MHGDPVAVTVWLAILWYKYEGLFPEVRERLEEVTKEVAQSGEMVIDACLSVMSSELERVNDAFMRSSKIDQAFSWQVN